MIKDLGLCEQLKDTLLVVRGNWRLLVRLDLVCKPSTLAGILTNIQKQLYLWSFQVLADSLFHSQSMLIVKQKPYRNMHELVRNVATVRLFKVIDNGLETSLVLSLCIAFGLVDMEDSTEVVDFGGIGESVAFC